MAQLGKTSYEAKYNDAGIGIFKTGQTRGIGSDDTRALVEDLADSVPFTADDSYTWSSPQVTATGTDTYAATPSPAITAYATGQEFKIKFTNASTGASTLNLAAIGAKKIFTNPTTQVNTGDIPANSILKLVYDSALDSATGGFLILGGTSSSGTSIPFGSTTGTNSYSATMSPVVAAYADGNMYHIRVVNSSTSTVTFDLGPGAKKAFVTSGSQAQAGHFLAGVDYLVTYKSTLDSGAGGFQVVNELIHGLMNVRGGYTSGGSGLYPGSGGSGPAAAIRHGDAFVMTDSDTLGTRLVQIGDLIFTAVDSPGQTEANWYIIPGFNSLALVGNKLQFALVQSLRNLYNY